MKNQEAVRTIRKFIERERAMRQRVFRHDSNKLTAKVADCDGALACLDLLAERLEAAEPEAVNLPLF